MSNCISRRNLIKGAASVGVVGLVKPGSTFGELNVGKECGNTGFAGAFKDGKYTLPELGYSYNALEPFYEERTLKIHHGKHHAGYVKGLNATLDKLGMSRKANDFSEMKALSRDLAFNGSGHILHCLFWKSMKPGGSEISGDLVKAFEESFGSVDAGKLQFAAATKSVEGSGWGILGYEPVSGKLVILQSEKHQNLAVWGAVPLLVCDVWEHAYYLQYANERSRWVDNFMKIANWEFAAKRLECAKGN